MSKPCNRSGCPGMYEYEQIDQALRFRDRLLVVEGVPAEVCDICGDTLLAPDVAEALERLVRRPPAPAASAPLYRYEQAIGGRPALLHDRTADVAGAD